MCGIFGIFKHKGSPVDYDFKPLIDKFFKEIETRGKDASGYCYISLEDNKLWFQKQNLEASKFVDGGWTGTLSKAKFNLFIGHVRHATQGPPTDNRNNHPLIANDVQIFGLVHNGVISTEYKGKRVLNSLVDTAVLRATISDYLEKKESLQDAIKHSVEEVQGSMTTAIISPTDKKLYLTKISNPLWLAYVPKIKTTLFCSTNEIMQNSLVDFFPKFLGVFTQYFIYEVPDDSQVIVSDKNIELIVLKPKARSYTNYYDWRNFSYKDDLCAYGGTYETFTKHTTLTDEPEKGGTRFFVGEEVYFRRVYTIWNVKTAEKQHYKFVKKWGKVKAISILDGVYFYDVEFETPKGTTTLLPLLPEDWLTSRKFSLSFIESKKQKEEETPKKKTLPPKFKEGDLALVKAGIGGSVYQGKMARIKRVIPRKNYTDYEVDIVDSDFGAVLATLFMMEEKLSPYYVAPRQREELKKLDRKSGKSSAKFSHHEMVHIKEDLPIVEGTAEETTKRTVMEQYAGKYAEISARMYYNGKYRYNIDIYQNDMSFITVAFAVPEEWMEKIDTQLEWQKKKTEEEYYGSDQWFYG